MSRAGHATSSFILAMRFQAVLLYFFTKPQKRMLHFSTSFCAILARVGVCMALGLLGGSALAQNAPTWASVQRGAAANINSGSNGRSIAVSADGSQYVTGVFQGTITLGAISLTAGPGGGRFWLNTVRAARCCRLTRLTRALSQTAR